MLLCLTLHDSDRIRNREASGWRGGRGEEAGGTQGGCKAAAKSKV